MRDRDKKTFLIIGKRLRSIRLERGLSQQALANLCDKTDRSKISDMENGKEDFQFSTLLEVCDGLKITISSLVTDLE